MSRGVVVITTLILLCACAPSPGEPQTLRFWVARAKSWRDCCRRSSAAIPICASGCSRFRGPPRTKSSSPRSPATRCPTSASSATPGGRSSSHWLEDLDARVAASSVVAADDYFGGIWDTNVIGGRLYGIPWYVDTRLLFYRSDLLARAGRATAELDARVDAIHAEPYVMTQGGPLRSTVSTRRAVARARAGQRDDDGRLGGDVLPVLVLFLALQKHYIQGLLLGSVKG